MLKKTYWMTLLTLFVASLLGANSDNSGPAQLLSVIFVSIPTSLAAMYEDAVAFIAVGAFFVITLFIILFSAGYAIFIGSPIIVGKCRYLSACRYGRVDIGDLFSAFKKGNYMSIVKTMFMKDLYVFLWSLLFIIPGIIKTYEYKMVPYILAENPGISRERAFEISKNTTYGEKWEMFVLDLSFIGWILLGMVACCGIGVFFLSPYIEATQAELYGALRNKAVVNGFCSPDEIGSELFSETTQF